MKRTVINTTKEEAIKVDLENTEVVRKEHLFSKNEYGESGFMEGTNADIYRCLAFMYNPTSGLLDHGLRAWNIDSKTGISNDEEVIQREITALTNYLKEAGVDELQNIEYEFADAIDGANETVLLKFNFVDNVSYVVDPQLQNLVRK